MIARRRVTFNECGRVLRAKIHIGGKNVVLTLEMTIKSIQEYRNLESQIKREGQSKS